MQLCKALVKLGGRKQVFFIARHYTRKRHCLSMMIEESNSYEHFANR